MGAFNGINKSSWLGKLKTGFFDQSSLTPFMFGVLFLVVKKVLDIFNGIVLKFV